MDKIKKMLEDKVVGAQLYVYHNEKNLKYYYGKASILNNKDISNKTIFRVASISKVVVAMGALKLMEQDKLDINQDISNYLGFKVRNPKYPNDIITTKMLMVHTSSILDGYDDEDLSHDGIEKGYNGVNGKRYDVKLKDLLTNTNSEYYSDNTYANYAPGENFAYSNFGTGILACIIEKCSNQYLNDFLRENIFKPLNIDASFKAFEIINQELISDTFYYDDIENKFLTNVTAQNFIATTYNNFELGNNFRGPAGGLYISMQDLGKIMQLLMHDGSYNEIEIFKKETIDLMLQMHYLGPNIEYSAKGLQLKFVDEIDNVLLKGHTGTAYNVRSFMFFEKNSDFGVCFIMNGGKYQDVTATFNDIQYEVLKYCYENFYLKTAKIVTIDKDLNVWSNQRKVILNDMKIESDKVYLSLIDLANILDVIPKITNEGIFVNNLKIQSKDNFIDLEEVLNILKVKYQKEGISYKIVF